jgi:hypothetical protein
VKQEALKNLETTYQETNKAPSISTIEASTMMEASMVNTPSKIFSQEKICDFEKHTRKLVLI